jgi:hypothetical protein
MHKKRATARRRRGQHEQRSSTRRRGALNTSGGPTAPARVKDAKVSEMCGCAHHRCGRTGKVEDCKVGSVVALAQTIFSHFTICSVMPSCFHSFFLHYFRYSPPGLTFIIYCSTIRLRLQRISGVTCLASQRHAVDFPLLLILP